MSCTCDSCESLRLRPCLGTGARGGIVDSCPVCEFEARAAALLAAGKLVQG